MAVQTTTRRILIVVALLAAGVLLFVAWLGGGPYTETWPTKFDRDRWKAASATWTGPDAHEDNTRCGMLMDLRFRVGIAGKSRNELVKLLGEPSGDESEGFWTLCPSFMDHWILEVEWQHGRAANVNVRDT